MRMRVNCLVKRNELEEKTRLTECGILDVPKYPRTGIFQSLDFSPTKILIMLLLSERGESEDCIDNYIRDLSLHGRIFVRTRVRQSSAGGEHIINCRYTAPP